MAAIKIEEMTPKQLARLVRDNPPGNAVSHAALKRLVDLRHSKRNQTRRVTTYPAARTLETTQQAGGKLEGIPTHLADMLRELAVIAQRTSDQLASVEESKDTA